MSAADRRVRHGRRGGQCLRIAIGCALAAAFHSSLGAPPPRIPDPERGALLYENQCIGCHTSVLHVREDRRSASYAAMRDTVRHWAQVQHLEWTEQEVDDVATFLEARYYHFEQPKDGGPK